MTVRKVLQLPADVLTTPSKPVLRIDRAALDLAEDLLETMSVSPACVGLAAPQIGVGLRAFAVDVTGHKKARSCHGAFVLFDPEVISSSDPYLAREGCMSVPDLTGDVARAQVIVVAGTNMEGKRVEMEVDAFEARAVQHEIDHLDGMLFLDRVAGPHSIFQRKTYR